MKFCASLFGMFALSTAVSGFTAQPPVTVSKTSLQAISGADGSETVSPSNSLNGIDYGSVSSNDYYVDRGGSYGSRSGRSDYGYGTTGGGGRGSGYGRERERYGRGYGGYGSNRSYDRGYDRRGSGGNGGYGGYGDRRGYRTRNRYDRSTLNTSNIADNYLGDSRSYGDRRRRYSSYNRGTGGYRGGIRPTADMFDEIDQISVQGGSLRTCSFHEDVERAVVFLKTEGRPLRADVNLWQGPDNSPQKMSVYLEDGNKRNFRAILETPGSSNAVAIRNTGELEYPITAGIELDMSPVDDIPFRRDDYRIIQGGAVYTTPFAPAVQSVRVCLRTDGRPLNARVELLQGPNNDKQVIEVYTEDGLQRPFHMILDTPGVGNVVRIVNTATVEFPLTAALEPYIIDENVIDDAFAAGGMNWS